MPACVFVCKCLCLAGQTAPTFSIFSTLQNVCPACLPVFLPCLLVSSLLPYTLSLSVSISIPLFAHYVRLLSAAIVVVVAVAVAAAASAAVDVVGH